MKKYTYLITCKTCGNCWTRTFHSKTDITEYLQLRNTCFIGYHIAEPSLKDHVTYKLTT